jgi:lysophospholipase L1-like esterase
MAGLGSRSMAGACAFMLVLALAAATTASGAAPRSTSSSGLPGHRPAQPVAGISASAVDPAAITFDEFLLGTSIEDDYADRGVVFTSDVFTSIDEANPTAPVLSGTPKYFGDIAGTFTVPGTTTPTTVNGFSLDVGYINNRNSVEILYYDQAGNVIGSTRAQSYGINTIDVFYRGVASFRVRAVTYEAAGFAIDNLVIHSGAVGIKPTRMAEFGDSYSSGEGLLDGDGLHYDCGTDLHEGRYYEGTTQPSSLFWTGCQTESGSTQKPRDLLRRKRVKYENLCHRHGRAYPNQIRERLGIPSGNAIFVACSGAETRHVGAGVGPEPQFPDSPPGVHGGKSQFDTVKDFAAGGLPDLITIGIGGNDAGFGGIIEECITSNCADLEFASQTISTINGTMFRNVKTTFENLRATFAAPPIANPATIVAFGYPSIIDDPNHWCKGFLSIDGGERAWIKNALLPTVNDAIKDAATDAGVVYVDITSTTAGHGVCSPDEWINGVRLGDDSWYGKGKESFHPNQKAHDAIATYFLDHYTDGNGQLLVQNPEPAAPIRPETGAEIRIGQVDVGPVQKCGADCLQPTACVQNCKVHVEGGGFAPGVTMGALLQSTPVTLGQVVADETGRIDSWFDLPSKLGVGPHSLTLDGTAVDGTRQHAVARFKVFGRVRSSITARFAPDAGGTVVRALAVKRMTSGTRVDIACAKGGKRVAKALAAGRVKRSRGCPFAHRVFRAGKGPGKAKGRVAMRKGGGAMSRAFTRYFKAPLKPGTVIRVVVTHLGQAGRTLDVRVRGRGAPKLTRGCTEPGLRLPVRC